MEKVLTRNIGTDLKPTNLDAYEKNGGYQGLKKAMKALAGDLQNVVKAVAAKEQAELKAVGLGISPQDLLSLANGGASGKGTGKAKAAAAAVCSAAAANAKSVGELLREPKCPTRPF